MFMERKVLLKTFELLYKNYEYFSKIRNQFGMNFLKLFNICYRILCVFLVCL